MNINLSHKIIKEMCGTVSFKRGDSFYRANKVLFDQYSTTKCTARVVGSEEFLVTIEKGSGAQIITKCSCPKLASFDKDCQHIAAVLLTIYAHQQHGSDPHHPTSIKHDLTEGLFTLFNTRPVRSSGYQSHFEHRQVLDTEFIFHPVNVSNEQTMLGVEIRINQMKIHDIKAFLENVKEGLAYSLSASFTYDQRIHCFEKETDAVIQELIKVNHDETVYIDTKQEKTAIRNQMLVIPPSSWHKLFPLLLKAPHVKVEYKKQSYAGLYASDEPLPLLFDFEEKKDREYQLKIQGLHQIVILNAYQSVLFEGKIIKLESQDSKRLSELVQMIKTSGTNQIPISKQQIGFFLEKVVPGLKRLGDINIPSSISKQLLHTPLNAKLYLDRVKNRLLVGIEFHYGNIMINPLENRDPQTSSLLIRDIKKEDVILHLMNESSLTMTDGGYFLHNEELEYQFLYHTVPKLQKLVQIYATTAVRMRIFRGNVQPQIRVKFKKERTNWLEFKFELDGIRDEHIKEVLQALEEKRKYYRLRNGSLLSLETREFEEIQRYLRSPLLQNKDLTNDLHVPMEKCLQLLDHVESSHVFKFEPSFKQFLTTIQSPGSMEFAVPKGLDSILKDYQKVGFHWMKTLAHYGYGGILADDMGLGKTIQSITFIVSELPEIRKNNSPILIVCPSSLTYNWLNEILKFSPEVEALVIDGSKKEREKLQKKVKEIDVVITSYPLLRSDIKWYEKQDFHTVFFDEAQAFKNPVTQTARAVKKIQADHKFALTGTPVENSPVELWSIFHVVFPDLFLGLKEFSKLSKKKIARRIRPFLLRRMKEDVLSKFPEKIESIASVELHPEQKKLYAAYLAKLRHDTLKQLDKETIRKNRIKILAGLTRLRQICCHPGLFINGYKGSSAKLDQLLQIVEEAKYSGRRVLIFSQFTSMLALIGQELQKKEMPYFYLDGVTPSEERVEICNRFNLGEKDFFLISLKAGGTGLNLMSADTVILFDTWWNPAVEEQATDRAHRIGQKNNVQVIKLVAKGTIEEKMNDLQDKKRHLVEEIIDSEEKNLSTLTEEDIREMLMI